jgi:hypothetical protein
MLYLGAVAGRKQSMSELLIRLRALRGDLLTTAALLALVGIILWFMP